jgi:hypothetical protein
MEIDIEHEGLLKQVYSNELTLEYLKGFSMF